MTARAPSLLSTGAASRDEPAAPASAPSDHSSPVPFQVIPVDPPSWAAAEPAVTTAAAISTRPRGRRPAATAATPTMTSGAAPMTIPTLAGPAARVASIISTLQPARPTTASPASHAHSRPAGRGSGVCRSRAQVASRRPATR